MKRIFTLAALIATTFSFAQDDDADTDYQPGNVISAQALFSTPGQAGFTYEREGSNGFWKKSEKSSTVLNLSYGTMVYEVEDYEFDGTGFVIEYGWRTYYGKNGEQFKGFYTADYFSYGSLEFDEQILFDTFEGTYSYFSFFSPELGYKFKFGKFVVDPFVGAQWKIEIKGKGDVDNNNTDEWAFRGGIKLGYNF